MSMYVYVLTLTPEKGGGEGGGACSGISKPKLSIRMNSSLVHDTNFLRERSEFTSQIDIIDVHVHTQSVSLVLVLVLADLEYGVWSVCVEWTVTLVLQDLASWTGGWPTYSCRSVEESLPAVRLRLHTGHGGEGASGGDCW